jgi:HTH-type transcriptional regulator / antitoxin HigA
MEMSVVEEKGNLTDLRLPAPKRLADYDRLRAILDVLIDEVGDDESHILAPFMDHVGELIEEFEDSHFPEILD